MKKSIKTLFAIAAAAIASVSCIKDNSIAESNFSSERTVNFLASSLDTKTSFTTPDGDSYPTVWNEGDQVKTVLNFAAESTATVTPSADGKTASFSINIAKDTTVYKFYAMSPASAYLSKSADMKSWGFTVPNTQTPTAKSVDPAAQILVAESESTTTLPEAVALSFSHWTSYARMSITNLDLKGATVSSVSVTTEKNIAGRWYYYCETTDAHQKGETVENSASNTITINTTSLENIWFALAPVDMSGKKMSVTVNTSAGTFTKEFTFSDNKKFESGKIAKFTVNMSGISVVAPKVYTRVKNVSELLKNSEVIIATFADTLSYAISTTQNSNNIAATAVTKSGNSIVDPSSSVEIFTVEAGIKTNTYAFKKKSNSKYIYAAGGTKNNYLKETAEKNLTAGWTVAFDPSEYAVINCADAAVTRGYLRYNYGNKLFSCYSSTSSVTDSVAIYKLEGSGDDSMDWKTNPTLAVDPASLNIEVGETIELDVTTNSDGEISFTSSDSSVAIYNTEEEMIEGLKAGQCNITVTVAETATYAEASVVVPVTVKAAGSVAVTLSQVLAAAQSKLDNNSGSGDIGTFDIGECTVVALSGSNYVVKDDTAVMLLFSKTASKVGDVITMSGKVTNYWGIAEINNPTITKVSSGATVNHGTATSLDEDGIAAYLAETNFPVVKYYKVKGSLGTDGKTLTVGSQTVTLYNALSDNAGKTVTVYGYSIGKSSVDKTTGKRKINFVNTSVEVSATDPSLSVDATSKTWAYDAADAFVAHVTATAGTWSVSPATLDWATVAVDAAAGTITVTPKGQNTSAADYEATLTVSHSAVATLTRTITLKQTKKPAEGVASYVLTSADIIAAHSAAWNYTSGMKSITAADGSQWSANNTFSNKNQATIQMNKGKTSYVLTPVVPSGKSISRLVVTCTTDNAGTKPTGVTRTFDITDASTGAAIATDIMGDDLTAGIDVSGSHTQLKIAPNETNGGACYIANITVQYN